MGSVHSYETSAGKRYRVLYRKPDHGQGQKRGFTTKRDAERFLHAIENSKDRGEFIDASAARSTVSQLGSEWLSSQTHLKPSSYRPVEIAWRLYVEPTWGNRSVGEIRHSQIQTWVSEMSRTKGATTVLRAYGVLAGILDVAVKDRRVTANAARGVNLPRKTGKKRVYLTHDQVQALADNAGDNGTMVLFLAYTGLRWGEATALRIGDIDTLRRRVQVSQNAVGVSGKIIVGTPKSHVSRSVPYPAFLSVPLARLCEGKGRTDLLFGDGFNHLHLPHSLRGWFTSAVKKSMATDPTFDRVTVHDMRHTAASLAISAGANVKAVQRMLGHASAAMTLDTYADLFDDDLDAVATALDQAKRVSSVANLLPETVADRAKTP